MSVSKERWSHQGFVVLGGRCLERDGIDLIRQDKCVGTMEVGWSEGLRGPRDNRGGGASEFGRLLSAPKGSRRWKGFAPPGVAEEKIRKEIEDREILRARGLLLCRWRQLDANPAIRL